MWIVAGELEIFEFEVVDVFDGRIKSHGSQRLGIRSAKVSTLPFAF
jgi:hypothetical protein